MSRLSTLRIAVGLVLIALGLSALVLFDSWMRLLGGLSPDGHVLSASWLALRTMIVALAIPGIALVGYRSFLRILSRVDLCLQSVSARTFLTAVIGAGALLRLIAVLAIPINLHMDFAAYDDRAWTWAVEGEYSNGIYPTAFWPPGWPFFLSRLYLVFGRVPEAGTFANVLFGAGIVWLTYLLIRAAWGESKARWAAVIVAVLPSQVLFTNVLCSEPLFTFLFLLAIVIVVHPAGVRAPVWRIAIAGIILGLATLTRSLSLLYPLLMIPLFMSEDGSRPARATRWLLLVVVSVGVVVPWCIRNYNELGRFTISTANGHNLYIGNNPMSRMTYHDPDPAMMNVWDPAQEARNDRIGYGLAFDHIVKHPVDFLGRGVLKTAYLLGSDTEALRYEITRAAGDGRTDQYVVLAVLMQGVWFVFILLAGRGALFFLTSGRPRNGPAVMISLTILYWVAIHFVFFGNGRYHFPIVPM
ncbi:MAG TPA: glycosyltransferase family 39 protein, partial [Acidobacteriota bacterium]|nr:glycosyltransferase family 39 protein [Acidobacteriota bacterium]